MIKAIIDKLQTITNCYALQSYTLEIAFLNTDFIVVDIGNVAPRLNHIPIFIYIYTPKNFFVSIKNTKEIKEKVLVALHKKTIKKKESKGYFWIEFVSEVFSKLDMSVDKHCVCLEFKVPAI